MNMLELVGKTVFIVFIALVSLPFWPMVIMFWLGLSGKLDQTDYNASVGIIILCAAAQVGWGALIITALG